MTEFVIVVVVWAALLLHVARRGTAHLVAPHTAVTMPLAGGIVGALLEALPTQPATPGFTLRTVIAVLAGVFAGRLLGKLAKLWAMGQERLNAGNPAAATPRLVHPLIAAGMMIAGVPALWHVVTSNHSFLEEELTPRDAKTGIAHGFEAVEIAGTGPNAALLLHDLYGSPAEFGDLPARLAERGFAVHAPLLPGHGTRPDDVGRVWAEDYRRAARAAFDALAANHSRVVVVGSSFGATLAIGLAAERPVAALVAANPYVGRLVTPSWCPVSYEALLGPMSRTVQRRIVPGDGLTKIYFSQSLHAAREARELTTTLDDAAAKRTCATLVILGESDAILPAAAGADWAAAHLGSAPVTLKNAGHAVFVGPGAGSAIDETLRFVVN